MTSFLPGAARRHPAARRRRVVAVLGLVCLSMAGASAADPLPARAERVADYRISVTLDPDRHELQGRERVVWHNTSTDEVSDLWFHLYLNAFKNSRSSFFRESGGQLRGVTAEAESWGAIDVTSIRLSNGHDLLPDAHFVQPDDDNVDDETVWRVPLPLAVAPGGTVAVDVEFKAKLPRIFARTGYYRDFHLVGQWFPKLGVYEEAGLRGRQAGGWNCHQFHATSEFYADFGEYVVDITVPSRFIVGATGMRTATRENPDGTVTHRYEQANVHDFAWTADPKFVEVRRTFSARQDVAPDEYVEFGRRLGRRPEEMLLGDVEIVLLMQREHLPQLERHVGAAKLAIKEYGLRYGPYPHRTVTIVDPATGAEGAGGMEYPTLFTAGTSALFNYWPFNRILVPETVIVHEYGHQYWQGMVANNEFEEAWLDEGVNTYAEAKVMEAGYGVEASALRVFGLSIGAVELQRSELGPWRIFDAIKTFTWDFSSEGAWAFNSYTKPGLVLRTLEGIVGEQTMARIMRTYQERWRFKHPSSADFYAVASDVADRDLRAYFRRTIESTDVLDYEVSDVQSHRERVVVGYVDGPSGRELKTSPADGVSSDGGPESDDPNGLYESTVTVRRRGGVRAPVVLEVKFDGQVPERYEWDGEGRWHRFVFTRPSRLEWANIDPERRLVLDVSYANNSRRVVADRRASASLATRWLFWMQNAIALLGA